jgi:predicted RNA binding protein YcfA (HicA-like mRNA interferase family)
MWVRRFISHLYDQATSCQRPGMYSRVAKSGICHQTAKGDHVIMKRANPPARVTVPNHRKDLKPGTLHEIIKEAGLTVDEFIQLL